MKKLSLKTIIAPVISALALMLPCTAGAQLRYGMTLGGDFSSSKLANADHIYKINTGSGFRGGLMLEYQLPGYGVAFDASVLYNRVNVRAAKSLLDPDQVMATGPSISYSYGPYQSIGRNFFEIPLNIKYKFGLPVLSSLLSPMVMTGPSFMWNLDKADKNPYLRQKRFQPGWNVGAGFDIVNFIQLSAGYRFPLGNSLRKDEDILRMKLKTRGWWLQVSMLFDF